MSLLELKQEYNELLMREAAAEAYLNDESNPLPKRMKWQPEYKKIIDRLNELIVQIEAETSRKLTKNEILGGFDVFNPSRGQAV